MKKLNQWLTLLANIGVIAGIVFLGVEIRQNTEMIRSQTRDSITEKQIAVFAWWATSTENNRIRKQGDQLELDLKSPEGDQYAWMIAGNLRLWEKDCKHAWHRSRLAGGAKRCLLPRIFSLDRLFDR
jgi:hypothetical protein